MIGYSERQQTQMLQSLSDDQLQAVMRMDNPQIPVGMVMQELQRRATMRAAQPAQTPSFADGGVVDPSAFDPYKRIPYSPENLAALKNAGLSYSVNTDGTITVKEAENYSRGLAERTPYEAPAKSYPATKTEWHLGTNANVERGLASGTPMREALGGLFVGYEQQPTRAQETLEKLRGLGLQPPEEAPAPIAPPTPAAAVQQGGFEYVKQPPTAGSAPISASAASDMRVPSVSSPMIKTVAPEYQAPAQARGIDALLAERAKYVKDRTEGREKRIAEQEAGIKGKKDRAFWDSLMTTGLQMMAAEPGQNLAQAAGKGALAGLGQYRGDLDKLTAEQRALIQERDALDEARSRGEESDYNSAVNQRAAEQQAAGQSAAQLNAFNIQSAELQNNAAFRTASLQQQAAIANQAQAVEREKLNVMRLAATAKQDGGLSKEIDDILQQSQKDGAAQYTAWATVRGAAATPAEQLQAKLEFSRQALQAARPQIEALLRIRGIQPTGLDAWLGPMNINAAASDPDTQFQPVGVR